MYTKGTWKAYCLGSEGYQIRQDNSGIPSPKVKEELKERLTPIVLEMGGSFETQKANANLIVSAVNGCISVNPENPQAVAESIKDMYEALKELIDSLGNPMEIPPYEVVEKASRALNKAGGKL